MATKAELEQMYNDQLSDLNVTRRALVASINEPPSSSESYGNEWVMTTLTLHPRYGIVLYNITRPNGLCDTYGVHMWDALRQVTDPTTPDCEHIRTLRRLLQEELDRLTQLTTNPTNH